MQEWLGGYSMLKKNVTFRKRIAGQNRRRIHAARLGFGPSCTECTEKVGVD
jgi:hypothetical protein